MLSEQKERTTTTQNERIGATFALVLMLLGVWKMIEVIGFAARQFSAYVGN